MAWSKWGPWIYRTDIQRKFTVAVLGVGGALLLAMGAAAVAALCFNYQYEKGPAFWGLIGLMAVVLLGGGAGFVYVIRQGWNWQLWKHSFLALEQSYPEGEDEALTVVLTQTGGDIFCSGKRTGSFRWEQVEAIRAWRQGWDIIYKPGDSGLSLLRDDITLGDAEAFSAFLQQMSKKELKPRAVEPETLREYY